MSKCHRPIGDGLNLVRESAQGARLVRVGLSRDGMTVLEFDNGAKFAIEGEIGVMFPVEGAAVVGDFDEWWLE